MAAKKLIGRVQIGRWSRADARADLSYALHFDFWGQGLMSEAVRPVAEFAWGELDLHRLEATVRPDNLASVRILESLGMTREGRLRDARRLPGDWVDLLLYARVR